MLTLDVREITACRSCGAEALDPVLDLGSLHVSGFPLLGQTMPRAPLEVVQCNACTLVQLRHTVSRDYLYRDAYWYRSGVQEAMVAALKDVAEHAMREVDLAAGDLVIDVGSNDGTLLGFFPENCIRIGFEPSPVGMETPNGITVMPSYFYPPISRAVRAKVITSIAQLYNVDDLRAYMRAVDGWLADDGVWVIQLAYLPTTLQRLNFGDFVHEHVTYWTLESLRHLVEQYGLHVDDWALNEVNGGSMRVVIRRGLAPTRAVYDTPTKAGFTAFAEQVQRSLFHVEAFITGAVVSGKKVGGYGASTKGSTMLDYWGIGPDLLPMVADRQPEKWGRTTVTGIPIVSEDEMRAWEPDYLLLLPFHFVEAFKQREHAFLARGGQFIVPLPTLTLVGAEAVAKAA